MTSLNSTSGDVAVVRQTRGKRRAIVESGLLLAFRHLQLLLESIDLFPVSENFLFFFREIRSLGNYEKNNVSISTNQKNNLSSPPF